MKKLIFAIATIGCLLGCTNKDKENAAIQKARQAAIDSVKYAGQRQRRIDSLEALTRESPQVITESPAMVSLSESPGKPQTHKVRGANPAPVVKTSQTINNTLTAPADNSVANATVAPATGGTVATAPEKKKGLNNAAKGAIIGLGTGAAAGAVIGKDNRVKGAVIGGVVGAVGGAVLDKRKQKKEAEQDSLKKIR